MIRMISSAAQSGAARGASGLALALFLFVARGAAQTDLRDTVVLKNGKEVSCRVLLELDDKVSVTVGTRERWIKTKDIRTIRSVRRSLAAVMATHAGEEDTVKLFLTLAKECAAAGLPHEARLFHWSVLLEDPDHATAHAALGHRQTARGWRLPVADGWHSFAQTEKIRTGDFGKAWRLRSEHFEIRTDAGLRYAVSTLLELENFYRHTFDLFASSLHLKEVLEPIQVHLYRDQAEFPRLSNTEHAYFSLEDNILFTFLNADKVPLTLFHQATHALIFNLGGSRKGRRVELPGWLNEAWADYMEGCLAHGKRGRVKLDLTRRLDARMVNLKGEKKLYSLRRVLNLQATDFSASSNQRVKYAQSYLLFLYMLEGEGQKYTGKFLEYVRDALAGKVSASRFRRVFRKDEKKIAKNYLLMK